MSYAFDSIQPGIHVRTATLRMLPPLLDLSVGLVAAGPRGWAAVHPSLPQHSMNREHATAEPRTPDAPACSLKFALEPDGATLLVRMAGPWRLGGSLPDSGEVRRRLEGGSVRSVWLDGTGVTEWDSSLLTFLIKVIRENERRQIATDVSHLPVGVQRLLALAAAGPPKQDAAAQQPTPS